MHAEGWGDAACGIWAETTAWAKAQGWRVTEGLGEQCGLARVHVRVGQSGAIRAFTHSAHIPEYLLCATSEEAVAGNPLLL